MPQLLPALLALLPLLARGGAPEPFPPLGGGGFTGPAVPASPDPLVRYVWLPPTDLDNLQIFNMTAVSSQLAPGTPMRAFANWETLTTAAPAVTVSGAGGLLLDFGVELPAWIELDSPDLRAADLPLLTLGTGEYAAVDIISTAAKQRTPVAYGATYRLETNALLYEGVRYAFIALAAAPSAPFTITGFRAVVQTKAVNYTGALVSGDALIDSIYYAAAYTVRTNLEPGYFGAILEDRGDRISWAGDAHVAQAASMAVFANFRSVAQNLNVTGRSQNGIASYTLYWVDSVCDYWAATGDNATLATYKAQMLGALAHVWSGFNASQKLTFFGWDDRLGSGFQNASTVESQWDFRFLAVRGWLRTADVLEATGDDANAALLRGYATAGMAWVRAALGGGDTAWLSTLGMHAAGEAANTGLLTPAEQAAVLSAHFNDSTTACSLSNFNQFWLLRAMTALGAIDRGMAMVKLCWGPELAMGGTTFWEISSPDWVAFTPPGAMVPNGENGYTSLCHPWSAGPTAWLAENAIGVRHMGLGSRAARLLGGRVLVAPHLQPPAAGAPVASALVGDVPLGAPDASLLGTVHVEAAPGAAGSGAGTLLVRLPAGASGSLVLSEQLLRRLTPGWQPAPDVGSDECGCSSVSAAGARAPLRLWPSLAAAVAERAGALSAADVGALRGALAASPLLGDDGEQAAAASSGRLALLPLAAGAATALTIDCRGGARASARAAASATAVDPPAPYPPAAWPSQLLWRDAQTRGSWRGAYGADGYALFGVGIGGAALSALPPYVASVSVVFSAIAPDAWATGSDDVRALQDPRLPAGAPGNRSVGFIASSMGGNPTFAVDVALAGPPRAFQLAVYVVDWDSRGRRQTLALLDGASLAPIAPIELADAFGGGVWLVWRVDRAFRLRISQSRGDNCVVSALLFDPVGAPPPPPPPSTSAAAAVAAPSPAYTCADDAGCERLGACVGGVCACRSGWTGASCGELDFAPAASCADCLPVWPTAATRLPGAAGTSAWGTTVAYDAADGLWHAFVTTSCNGSGVVGDGGGASWIAHLASAAPDRGFRLRGMFAPQTTFGPHVVVSPTTGEWALVFRVNVLLTAPLCSGNGSGVLPASFADGAYVPASALVSGDPEKGTSIYIATAPRATGPWAVRRIDITGAGALHKSNPSLAWLRDGRLLMAYRYNAPGGELNAVAVSTQGAAGPFANIANITAGRFGDEDPFAWQEARDGSLHIIWHNRQFGYHASADEAGLLWAVSPTAAHAFTLNVTLDSGATLPLLRRERPELRFDAVTRAPLALYAGVQAADTTCFGFAQALRNASDRTQR